MMPDQRNIALVWHHTMPGEGGIHPISSEHEAHGNVVAHHQRQLHAGLERHACQADADTASCHGSDAGGAVP
jgi:hypothetical protein